MSASGNSSIVVASTVLMLVLCANRNALPSGIDDAIQCEDEIQAGEMVLSLGGRDWTTNYRLYLSYKKCDDGYIAEAFSDSIAYTLTKHWTDLYELNDIVMADKCYLKFVAKHIDATIDNDTLLQIKQLAVNECPKKFNELCKAIVGAVDDAIRDGQ